MTPDLKDRDIRWIASSACVVIISLLIQFYVTHCGLLLTHDSREYLSAAQSFGEEGVFNGTDGSPFVYWPPLFPVILSLFANPQTAMVWINMLVSALIGVLISRLAFRQLTTFGLRIGFLIGWMWGVHQLLIAVFLWSELIFLLLLLLFVEFLLKATVSRAALAGAFLVGFMLCLQRNAGLFIVPAAAVWLLLRKDSRRAPGPAIIILLSVVGGVWWNASNMFGSVRTEVGELVFFSSMLNNVLITTDGLAQSTLPFTIFSIPFAIVIICSPVVLLWPSQRLSDHLLLMALICSFYIAGMAIQFKLDPGDADRYAAVILPFFLLTIFWLLEGIFMRVNNTIGTILLIGMVLWLAYPLLRTARNAVQWHDATCVESVL